MKKLLLVLAVAGCGGNDTKLTALDSGGEADLCSYLMGHAGAKRTIDCGSGSTITVGGGTETQADCVASIEKQKTDTPSCPATVGDVEDCFDAEQGESDAWYCSQLTATPQAPPSACVVLSSAACESTAPRLSSLASGQLSVETAQ